MATTNNQTCTLIKKLKLLSPDRVVEVEDFVDFLKSCDQEKQLFQASTVVAEDAFSGVWDNLEDSVYDYL